MLRLIETKVHEMMKRKLEETQRQIRQWAATADAGSDGTQATTSTAGTQMESEMGLVGGPTRAVATTQTEPDASSAIATAAAVTATAGEGAPEGAGRCGRRRRWRKRKSGCHPGDLRVVRWAESSADSDSEEGQGPQRRVIEVDL